jgi:pimeloyl-ACP methyl ester carboxylesterase
VPVFRSSHYAFANHVDDFADPWRPHATVFLLPGFCRTMDFWRAWVPELARTLTVVRLEMPGCGSSPAVPADAELSFDSIVADVHEMLTEFAPGGAHLVGESSGGLLAALLADRHPASVRSLTMVSTPIGVGQRTAGPHSLGHASWDEALRQLGMREWWLRSRREVVGVPVNPDRDDHWADEFARTPVATALRYRQAVVGQTVGSLLPALRVPALVMRPERSPFMGEDDLAAWQVIPRGEVRTYPLNNDMYYLSPAPLVADCAAFLNGVDIGIRLGVKLAALRSIHWRVLALRGTRYNLAGARSLHAL